MVEFDKGHFSSSELTENPHCVKFHYLIQQTKHIVTNIENHEWKDAEVYFVLLYNLPY